MSQLDILSYFIIELIVILIILYVLYNININKISNLIKIRKEVLKNSKEKETFKNKGENKEE
jgi:uncharacterized protein YxeA